MALADDGDHSSAPGKAEQGSGLRLPPAFCPVCGAVWDDPRRRCPNSAKHPAVPAADKPAGEHA
jgi:hypothetical protein